MIPECCGGYGTYPTNFSPPFAGFNVPNPYNPPHCALGEAIQKNKEGENKMSTETLIEKRLSELSREDQKPKVVIICSLSSKNKCMAAVELFEELFGAEVYHPFLDQHGSLFRIQNNYLKQIDKANLVVAIPKDSWTDEADLDCPRTHIISQFGESTTYELAYARHIRKRIIFLSEGW